MSLSGTLDTMSARELVGWMAQRKHTGILKFKTSGVDKTLNIDAGRVVNAASTDPREYFGQFLINFGMITEDQLQKAFETQQETKVLLGKILAMTGLVTEEQVEKMLQLKIRETLLDVYLWDSGAFEFHDGLLSDETSEVPAAVNLEQLNAEGVDRQKRYLEIRKAIPSNACPFQLLEPAASPLPDPKSSAGVMLELARKGYSATDIILRFHSVDYPILYSLHEMVMGGILKAMPPRPATQEDMPVIELDLTDTLDDTPSPDLYLLEAQKAMQARDFERSIDVLKKGLEENPFDPDLSDALEVAEHGLLDGLRASLLSKAMVPVLLQPDVVLKSTDLTPPQRYILSRIDGRRHLKSIIMVSPLKEVDALRTFRMLIDKGIVGIK